MDCSNIAFEILPWLGLLILLNATELVLLIGMTVRLRAARDTIMDAVEARLLELERDRVG